MASLHRGAVETCCIQGSSKYSGDYSGVCRAPVVPSHTVFVSRFTLQWLEFMVLFYFCLPHSSGRAPHAQGLPGAGVPTSNLVGLCGFV